MYKIAGESGVGGYVLPEKALLEFSNVVKRYGDTTVVDAYLSPILRRYVDQVERDLTSGDSRFAWACAVK